MMTHARTIIGDGIVEASEELQAQILLEINKATVFADPIYDPNNEKLLGQSL
jgi:hypothetical protein